MNWSASALTAVSSDTEPTVVITFDSAKYIFNTGENTNRAFLQSRGNWRRSRGLFFTHVGTQRTSGLPGLLMSFADATIPRLDLVGPPGLLHLLATMRSYTFRDSMPIYPKEASWNPNTSASPDPIYKDDNITVYSIPILPSPESPKCSPSSIDPVSIVHTSESSLKRKRDSSPDSPVKRPILTNSVKGAEDSPEILTGEAAQDWRRLMIDTMFPDSRQKNEKKNAKATRNPKKSNDQNSIPTTMSSATSIILDQVKVKQGLDLDTNLQPNNSPQAESSSNIDTYKRPRVPSGFYKQLPKFTTSVVPASKEKPTFPTLAYIVVGPRVRGKFDVKKAEALGVPFGPLRGRLTKGLTITFRVEVDGEVVERVVRPEECVGESEPPGSTLILDIPTPMHIPNLIKSFDESPFYSKFRSTLPEDTKEYAVRSVFHICGDDVLEDERYIAFMNDFAPEVHHVVSSREHVPDPVTFTSVAFNQLRLNQLDPSMFPISKFSLSPRREITSIPNLPAMTYLMSSGLQVNIRPPIPPRTETFDQKGDLFHPAVSSQNPDVLSLPALTLERFAEAKVGVENHLNSETLYVPKGADVGIIPLGTGSAVPTKYRNVSSTLIQIPNWGNMLLDAGEGTWGQLVRQFGLDDSSPLNIWHMIRNLKCIFISHIHGDHHIGLTQILAKRRMLDPPPLEPLYLVTVRAVHLYLRELSDLQDLGLDDPSGNGVITIMSESLHWKNTGYQKGGMWQIGGDEQWTDFERSRENLHELCSALGLESFQTVDMHHRTRCYGAVIKHQDGWSIVFSADTQPTDSLVWAGRNATLLIHEATMADDQVEMAKRKAHSTFGQAVEIGKRMNAENILLTHFSARYPKMPPSCVPKSDQIEENSRQSKEPVLALAFDHANLTIGDMWKLNYYLPAVEQSFRDTVEEDDGDDINLTVDMDVDAS